MSHLFVDTFFELAVVGNVPYASGITVILALEAFGWMSQRELKISPVSK